MTIFVNQFTKFLNVVRFLCWGSSRARIVFGCFTSLLKTFESFKSCVYDTNLLPYTFFSMSFYSGYSQFHKKLVIKSLLHLNDSVKTSTSYYYSETKGRTTGPIEFRVEKASISTHMFKTISCARCLPVATIQWDYLIFTHSHIYNIYLVY